MTTEVARKAGRRHVGLGVTLGHAMISATCLACGGGTALGVTPPNEVDGSIDASDAGSDAPDARPDSDTGPDLGLPRCRHHYECWSSTIACQLPGGGWDAGLWGYCCNGILGPDGVCRCGTSINCDLNHECCAERQCPDGGVTLAAACVIPHQLNQPSTCPACP